MAGLLVPLDVFLLAGVALVLILAGVTVIRPLLVNVLSGAPVIGGWLAANVDAGLAAYQRWLNKTAQPWVAPLAEALGWLAWVAAALPSALRNVADAAYAGLWNLRHLDLPALEARAAGFAAASVNGLHALVVGMVAAAESTARGLFGAAEAAAVALFQTAEADAIRLVQAERVAAQDLFAVAQSDASALVAQVRSDAMAGIGEAENLATELVREERAAMLAAVGIVEHDLQALAKAENVLLADSIALVGGEVTASAAQAKSDLNAAEQEFQRRVDTILESLPWASLAAGVAASEAYLKSETRALVLAGAAEIRKSMGDAEAIRAKYGPQVRAALADLRKAV